MLKDSSWILAFIEDLRDVAGERALDELKADLDGILERHRPLLSKASLPCANAVPPGNVVPLGDRRRA